MKRSETGELLNEIVASCPALAYNGFYCREIRSSLTNDVELRLLASLDKNSRRTFIPLIANRGLKLIEENNLLIIY